MKHKFNILTLLFFCVLFLYCSSIFAENVQFSKVFFFGDELSDIGNNQDGLIDQAPVINKVKSNDHFRDGDTWVIPFVQYLKQDNLLMPESTTDVKPSVDYDKSIEIGPWDSVDFAYSGDPSGGYPLVGGKHVSQYHLSPFLQNTKCVDIPLSPPSLANDLCGTRNRGNNYSDQLSADPNALYIIWTGINDIFQNQDFWKRITYDVSMAIKTGQPINQNEIKQLNNEIKRITLNAGGNIGTLIYKLKDSGAQHFLIINLPNLAYSPTAWALNNAYSKAFPSSGSLISDLFKTLSDSVNALIKQLSDRFKNKYPVIQPDITQFYNLINEGKLAAFPASSAQVNVNPILSWFNSCCSNQEAGPYYDPTKCIESSICSGPLPKLPDNQGHYVFYDGIHPTTCAAKYIARFVESYIPGGKPFDPNEQLCSDDE